MKIVTDQSNPYGNEWCAYDSDTYDASYEGPEDGWVSHSPMGWGKTKGEAIADLMAQIEENSNECA